MFIEDKKYNILNALKQITNSNDRNYEYILQKYYGGIRDCYQLYKVHTDGSGIKTIDITELPIFSGTKDQLLMWWYGKIELKMKAPIKRSVRK